MPRYLTMVSDSDYDPLRLLCISATSSTPLVSNETFQQYQAPCYSLFPDQHVGNWTPPWPSRENPLILQDMLIYEALRDSALRLCEVHWSAPSRPRCHLPLHLPTFQLLVQTPACPLDYQLLQARSYYTDF